MFLFIFKMKLSGFFYFLLFTTISFATSSEGKVLQDANVDVNSVVSDLQNRKRSIFAVGPVNSKLTLFISGPEGSATGGFLAQVDADHSDGIFQIGSPTPLVPMPSGVPDDADVKFVCLEGSSSKLVTMNKDSVGVVGLPGGGFDKLSINDKANFDSCYHYGDIHVPSSQSLYYFTLNSTGWLAKFHFDSSDIKSSESCNYIKGSSANLCISGTQITVSDTCQSPLTGLTSGFVGDSTTYLFDTSNAVYIFSSTVFTNKQAVSFKKVNSNEAWKVEPTTPKLAPPSDNPIGPNQSDKNASMKIIFEVLIIVACIVLCLIIFMTSLTCYKDPWWVNVRANAGCCKSKKTGEGGDGHKKRSKKKKHTSKKKSGSKRSKSRRSSKKVVLEGVSEQRASASKRAGPSSTSQKAASRSAVAAPKSSAVPKTSKAGPKSSVVPKPSKAAPKSKAASKSKAKSSSNCRPLKSSFSTKAKTLTLAQRKEQAEKELEAKNQKADLMAMGYKDMKWDAQANTYYVVDSKYKIWTGVPMYKANYKERM